MSTDSRIAGHIGASADGYQITPAFLHAAAGADIVRRVDGGFGYDPYFLLPEAGMTAAELDADRKNRESHRGQALVQLVERLKNRRA